MSIQSPIVPKHVRVREALRSEVRGSKPGDALASERELMQRFDVSRATVRAAIQGLVEDGLVVKEAARGTFVAERRVESRLHLASFTEDMLRRGHVPTTQVLSFASAGPDAASDFLDGPTWRIERLRLADGEPIAYEITHVSTASVPMLGAQDLAGSLYETLRTRYDLAPDGAQQSVTAVAADSRLAALLHCREGAPLLLFDRRSSSRGHPVERTLSWYLGDRYALHVDLDSQMPQD